MKKTVIDENESPVLRTVRMLRSYLVTFLVILSIVLVVNLFIARLVKVDGHSMESTLHNGELLVLDEISYKFKDPKRYDIVVFTHEDKLYIKRIIGLPGEKVQIKNGEFYINGKLLEEHYGYEPIDENMYGRAKDEVELAKDEYFCVGDNRNHSGDSRLESVGNVKKDIIKGRAIFRLLPFGKFGKLN